MTQIEELQKEHGVKADLGKVQDAMSINLKVVNDMAKDIDPALRQSYLDSARNRWSGIIDNLATSDENRAELRDQLDEYLAK